MASNPGPIQPPDAVSGRGDGILVEFWQMDAGASEAQAYCVAGVLIDTHGWREDVATNAREAIPQFAIVTLNILANGRKVNRYATVDLTTARVVAGAFTRTLHFVESRVMTHDGDTLVYSLLSEREIDEVDASGCALRFRVMMRRGDAPVTWLLERLTEDGARIVQRDRLVYEQGKVTSVITPFQPQLDRPRRERTREPIIRPLEEVARQAQLWQQNMAVAQHAQNDAQHDAPITDADRAKDLSDAKVRERLEALRQAYQDGAFDDDR